MAAVHSRHAQIEQDDVGMQALRSGQGLDPVLRSVRLVSNTAQQNGQAVGRIGVVVDNQHQPSDVGPRRNFGRRRHCAVRQRREPEVGVLFRSVQAEWNTFVQRAEAGERMVPRFCRREVEGYLRCGILGFGFARVHCGVVVLRTARAGYLTNVQYFHRALTASEVEQLAHLGACRPTGGN